MRKKAGLPPREVLNQYDIQCLLSPSPVQRQKAYVKLYEACGRNLSLMSRWLKEYYPSIPNDRKTLRAYIRIHGLCESVAEDFAKRCNGLVSVDELRMVLYVYLKKKLKRCIQPQFTETFSEEDNWVLTESISDREQTEVMHE